MSAFTEADIALCARRWHEQGRTAAAISFDMVCWLNDAVVWEQAAIASRVQVSMARLTAASAEQPRFAATRAHDQSEADGKRLFALRIPVRAKQSTIGLLRLVPQIHQVVDLMAYDRHEQHGVVVVISDWTLEQFRDFVAQARGVEVARLVDVQHDHRARSWLQAQGDLAGGADDQAQARPRSRG